MNAILLSAGFGTRFQPYTNTTAKPTIPFLNLPLLAYSMYYANQWQANNLVINTHHLPDTIKDCSQRLNNTLKSNLNLINESPNILDSGGGIKNAEHILNQSDDFLVFNTDIPHVLPNVDFKKIIQQHKSTDSLVTFLTCDIESIGTEIKGLWVENESNQVKDIGLGPKDNLICKHYMGVMLISKKLLTLQPVNKPHNIIYDVILPALNDGHRVSTYHINNLKWFETGNLNSYLDASFEALTEITKNPNSDFSTEINNIFKQFGINNQTIHNDKFKLLYSGKKPTDLGSVTLSGSIVLGDNISLNQFKSLSNSVIFSNTDVNTNCCDRQLIL